ncbi:protein Largen isoform 2-T2 [Sarcophilus harrisii]
MSAKSKGTTSSSSSPTEGQPAASKTKVKEQIKIIVEDLELVLGDLKDVAKELKERSKEYVKCGQESQSLKRYGLISLRTERMKDTNPVFKHFSSTLSKKFKNIHNR